MELRKIIEGIVPKRKGNIVPLCISRFLSAHGFNIHEVLWQPYVLLLGGNVLLIGILRSIWDIVSSWFQRLGGRLSDYLGRKVILILASFLTLTSIWINIQAETWQFLLMDMFLLPGLILIFPAIFLLALAFSFSNPAAQAIVAESVGLFERGKAYAFYFLLIFIPALYIPIVAGYLVGVTSFSLVWKIILFMEGGALVVALIFLKETLVARPRFDFHTIFTPIKEWVKLPRELRKFGIAVTFDGLAWSLWMGIMFGMLIQSYRFTPLHLGFFHAIFFGTMVFTQIPMGKLVDKYGAKLFLISSELFLILALLGFIHSERFFEFLLSYFMVGIAGALWLPAYSTYIAKVTSLIERGKVIGDLNALRGAITFPAPIVGSVAFTFAGFDAPLHGSIMLAGVAFLLLFLIKE